MGITVKLRQKSISGNRHTLYLDFYPAIPDPKSGNPTRRQFLKLYLFDKPKNPSDKLHNKETKQLAEQIRQKRDNQVNKPEIYTDFEKEQLRLRELGNRSFNEYFKQLADKRKSSNHDNWISAYHYLVVFTKGDLKFADLNEKFCDEFKEYLLNTKRLKSDTKTLSRNACVSYFNKLKAALKQAFKDGFLQVNLNDKIEQIETGKVFKNTLTVDELNKLAKTDCPSPLLRKATFFSALTGVPFAEMQNLLWSNIEVSESAGLVIRTTRQKTHKPYVSNISKQAYLLLGDPQHPSDKVFTGLSNKDRYDKFPLWLVKAGIQKKLTFHDLRHTYGTNQIDAGTDIYVLMGNMAHSNVRYTQQYGHQSDRRKKEAAESVKLDL